jgi:hypothetical protein
MVSVKNRWEKYRYSPLDPPRGKLEAVYEKAVHYLWVVVFIFYFNSVPSHG